METIFSSVAECYFCECIDKLKPSPQLLADCLRPEYSDDPFMAAHEERVGEYLRKYVLSLAGIKLACFLKYVTGMDLFISDLCITVVFNSISEMERMVPTANTCSATLHMSRFFLSYITFEDIMNSLLKNRCFWDRFDLITQTLFH